ncbi:MAG: 16S rRNA (cytidine(1402)-2'-O)-methyltransferase [Caldisericaceae bacterium]|nr:16S rRNA (cytidine(1402)-2'-O)-methyltransferase [Caldisericaceae bacterium]
MALYVCPTPIGNLKDITIRVILVLRNADIVAAEDTRKTRILFNKYSIKTKLVSFHSYSPEGKSEFLLRELKNGKNVALVTDAGTPGISDPGYKLIKSAIDLGIHIEVLPGPTAFVTALLLSGFPPAHFAFYGFLPRKKGKRVKIIKSFEDFPGPVIFYESPFRVKTFLENVIEAMGKERKVAIAREITKIHEEVLRGTAEELLEKLGDSQLKGEVVIVLSPKDF